MRKDITTDLRDIESKKQYYEQFCAHQLDYLNEMDQILVKHRLPKFKKK